MGRAKLFELRKMNDDDDKLSILCGPICFLLQQTPTQSTGKERETEGEREKMCWMPNGWIK